MSGKYKYTHVLHLHVIVRSVGVGRVEVYILCACVSEEHGNGEVSEWEDLSRLSDTRRYISLAVESVKGWGLW